MKVVLLVLVFAVVVVFATEIRLIETAPGVSTWMTEDEVLNLIRNKVNFMDITDHREPLKTKSHKQSTAIPSEPTHQAVVNEKIGLINIRSVESNIATFSAFNNRYYTSTTGQQSSNWLFETAKAYSANRTDITVSQFKHTWLQNSVIARIAGSNSNNEIVVLGAHQDSINSLQPANGRAPGSDDDASGTMTILEVFRILAQSNFRPEITLEFQWYAAEEVGLRGSQDIVDNLVDTNTDVRAMMQLDMDGYDELEQKVAIITDYTDAAVNQFIRQLVDEYCAIGWVNALCGYACSDHASFDRAGYPASHPYESQLRNGSPYLHTTRDDISTVSMTHVLEFTKMALGYAIELSYN